MMRRSWISCVSSRRSYRSFPLPAADQEPTVEDFIGRLRDALEVQGPPALPRALSPRRPGGREESLASRFRGARDGIRHVPVGRPADGRAGEARVFLQVLFENAYSAIVEIWQLGLARTGRPAGRSSGRTSRGASTACYKVELPPEGAERVSSVEIDHADIRTLVRATPPSSTTTSRASRRPSSSSARGRVRFAPSDPVERHQLSLIYKNPVLEDRVSYAYIRCSDTLLQEPRQDPAGTGRGAGPSPEGEGQGLGALRAKPTPAPSPSRIRCRARPCPSCRRETRPSSSSTPSSTGELTYIYYPFSDEEVNLFDRGRERIVSLYSPRKEE